MQPGSPEERLERIKAIAERIAEYVRYMCAPGTAEGTSAEAKERALAAFYQHLAIAEGQLGKIHDEYRLQ